MPVCIAPVSCYRCHTIALSSVCKCMHHHASTEAECTAKLPACHLRSQAPRRPCLWNTAHCHPCLKLQLLRSKREKKSLRRQASSREPLYPEAACKGGRLLRRTLTDSTKVWLGCRQQSTGRCSPCRRAFQPFSRQPSSGAQGSASWPTSWAAA